MSEQIWKCGRCGGTSESHGRSQCVYLPVLVDVLEDKEAYRLRALLTEALEGWEIAFGWTCIAPDRCAKKEHATIGTRIAEIRREMEPK